MTGGWIKGPVLGIETTGRLTGAAVFADGRLLAEGALDARARSQEMLLAQAERLLHALDLAPRDLARIGVALGPGSFTGVRVGLASARALALGADLPLAGVPSHEALAWPFRDLDRPLVLLTGLRRGEVFLEAGRWKDDVWCALLPGVGVPVGDVRAKLAAVPGAGSFLFLGEAAGLPDLAGQLAGLGQAVMEPLASVRRPAVIACLAARPGAPVVQGIGLDALEPLYLRAADARRPGVSHG
jgi:tRNA threonylcarbamoyladenosine biosynthesis protein TsaB